MSQSLMTMEWTEKDARKLRDLRRMKLIPLVLLAVAAIAFIVGWIMSARTDAAVWGFVRAAGEAGIVGGLADWFAVTALFRRPLGLPIPHTNLIATKKDQLGASLSEFVQTNFLTEQTIRTKVRSVTPTLRIGQYLQDPRKRDFILCELSAAAETGIDSLNDDDVAVLIRNMAFEQAASFSWSQPAGALLDAVVEDRAHVPAIDAFLRVSRDWIRDNSELIVNLVAERGPAQNIALARSVHLAIGRKAHTELLRWIEDAYNDPNSTTRQAIESWLVKIADELRNDPEMIAKVEDLKHKLLDSPELQEIVASVWPATKRILLAALADPHSELRQRADMVVAEFADRLVTDQQLQERIDHRIERMAVYVAERYGAEITTIITDTIERWDTTEASRRIELQVGRDLQFIRINGTVVGAIAGLAIHAFAVLVLS